MTQAPAFMTSRRYSGWVLGLLAVVSLFAFVDRQVIGALGQAIKLELKLSDADLGLVGGIAFALFNSVLSIPIARLAETRRRVTLIGAGVFLWSIATCMCGLAAGFAQLVLARACVGLGEAAGQPATNSLLADYFPREKRTSAAAAYALAIPAGAFLGAAGGGWLAQAWGWRWAFVVAGAPGLLLGLILVLTIKEPLRGFHDGPGAAAEAAPPFAAVLRRMVERPAFLHHMLGSTVCSMGGFGINLFLAAYLNRRFGLGYAQAGLLTGLISAIPGSISMLGGGLLADALGRRDARFYAWVPGIGALIAAPLYILAFAQASWPAAAALLMATGIFQYAYLPTSSGVSQNIMAPRMRASAAAIVGIMTNVVGAGLAPLIVGALSDRFAAHAFAGDFAAACAGARSAAGACRQASASGLQWACTLFALVYLWAVAHFALAARTLRRDMA
jgi:MFS family permease